MHHRPTLTSSVLMTFGCALFASQMAAADTLYSVNTGTDQLVSIDTNSGAVTVVADLSVDVHDCDMAMHGNTVFIFNSKFNARSRLYAVDHRTGEVLSNERVHGRGDGLASAGQYMAISLDFDANGSSEIMRLIDQDGRYHAILDFTPYGADFDGMACDPDGNLYTVDVAGSGFTSHSPTLEPMSYPRIGNSSGGTVNDVAFSNGVLWGMDNLNGKLLRIDPASGRVVGSVSLNPPMQLLGLAEAPSCNGDLTGDGVIDAADLSELLSLWGENDMGADMNGDGIVNAPDIAVVISLWGPCP